ncbi:DeoR family transcriptional regulator [Clostridia bacterium]|nr:DeoR family transcriptional regulator [Clostridia bacterium]
MIKEQRQQQIIQLLEENDVMMNSALAEYFGTSLMTIRRDIDELAEDEIVIKLHGGVALKKTQSLHIGHVTRVNENTDLKKRIGAEAAKLIQEGMSVFFDAGSTPLFIARNVPPQLHFTAITNSLVTATELCKKVNTNVIMIGGELYKPTFATRHNSAVDSAAHFRSDISFISTKTISPPKGLYEMDLSMIEVKLAMAERAENVIVVADHTKFNISGTYLSIPMSDIDLVITDTELDQKYVDLLKKGGTPVTLT